MTVTCGRCQRIYLVHAEHIPATGARMRCQACGHVIYLAGLPWIEPDAELDPGLESPVPEPEDGLAVQGRPASGPDLACHVHGSRPAVAMCCSCGNPVCEACRNKLGGRNFCDPCAREELDGWRPGAPARGAFSTTLQLGARAPAAPPIQVTRDPFLAGLLSFLMPGLGQIYNGQVGKGIGTFLFCIFSWLFAILVPLVPALFGFAFYVWSIADAYRTARQLNTASQAALLAGEAPRGANLPRLPSRPDRPFHPLPPKADR